jgi:hypothetical protein
VLEPFLRKSALVFFDDIMVYSSSLELHINHLKNILETLRNNHLFARKSKWSSCKSQVEYLGHIMPAKKIATILKKTAVVRDWPPQKTLKELRGFLGLSGYYMKFIKGFGIPSKSLTELLKKMVLLKRHLKTWRWPYIKLQFLHCQISLNILLWKLMLMWQN